MLSEGTEAPDFTLSGLGPPDEDGTREFTEYHFGTFAEGSSTLLAFYPGDFSPVCTAELCSLEGDGAPGDGGRLRRLRDLP
jgi:peroxiredoxin Q/BCP